MPAVAKASHIVGGELTYTFLSYSSNQSEVNYRITMNLYRDLDGISFPNQVDFGVFIQEDSGAWSSYTVAGNIPIAALNFIPPEADPCKTSSFSDKELEGATYSFDVALEVSDHNYMIAYQACCRNFNLNNIESIGDIGAVYDITISPEAQRLGNSSPTYNAIPPQFVCANFDINVDHSAIDIDGDSLVYKFCIPISPGVNDASLPDCCGCVTPNPFVCTPPYDEVVFTNGFTPDIPMGGDPTITIDRDNGFINGVPSLLGAYVVAVCVEEYRNGLLLSTVRRDFQFIVISCSENLVAEVEADAYIEDTINNRRIASYESCGDLDFNMINLSTDVQYIQDYSWQIFDSNNNLLISKSGLNNRDTQLNFPTHGIYNGYMILNDGATCFDTAFLRFVINEDIDLSFTTEYDTCLAGPVTFLNLSTPDDIKFTWALGDGSVDSSFNVNHLYPDRGTYEVSLSAIDSLGCIDSLTQFIDWYPIELFPPDTISIDTTICYHDSIFIYGDWISEAGIYFNYIPNMTTGCDSIVEKYLVDLTDDIGITFLDANICIGDSFDFDDRFIMTAGTYLDTLISSIGCDSIIELNLTVLETSETSIVEEICSGDNFIFDQDTLINPGIYVDTLINILNCDSIVVLDLIVNENTESFIDVSICENEFYIFEGDTLTAVGQYEFTINNSNNCDSIIQIDLVQRPISEYSYMDTICSGETYNFGSQRLTTEGIYFDTLTNTYGCDSIIVLDLIVGQNLSRIDLDGPLEEIYGSIITLVPEVIGEELVTYVWSENDQILSNAITLEYLLEDDSWIYFQSTNELYCAAVDSIFIRSIIEKNVYIPNAFSPNGDGFNDIFYLGASNTLVAHRLTVFDRWGNLMFQNDKSETITENTGWNGTFNNENVEIGTYTYMFELFYINGDTEIRSGSVNVFR
jgi:gliding motility-associated-like protein